MSTPSTNPTDATLDARLRSTGAPSDGGQPGLDRARLEALRALRHQPPLRSWRKDALLLVGCSSLVTLVLLGGGVALGLFHGPATPFAAVAMAVLFAAQLAGAWAAAGPPRWSRMLPALLLGGSGMAMIVLERAERGLTAASAGWVCSVSHLSVDLVPFVAALMLLRQSARNVPRAVVAGLAMGTVGPLLGELGCPAGWQHVLVWHVGAWTLLVLLAAVIAPRMRRLTHAP